MPPTQQIGNFRDTRCVVGRGKTIFYGIIAAGVIFDIEKNSCRNGIGMLVNLLGIGFLLFRIWIVEVKLVEELQFRRRFFSRFFSYYAGLALAFGLSSCAFNIIVMIAFPILLVTSIWDVRFYQSFLSQDHWKENQVWGFIERTTLHPPVVMLAIYMILADARNFIIPPNLILLVVCAVTLFLPFFLFDVRWTKRYKWPEALIVIGLVISSSVSLLLAEAFLWGVPIW